MSFDVSTIARPGPAPRRHPEGGGYPNGEETRLRLIKTAIKVFGRSGFKQASTREIAAEAGVKTPALQYYFHSKVGLHHACVDFVTSAISKRLQPLLDAADAIVTAGATPEAIIDQVCLMQHSMLDSFYDQWEGSSLWHLLEGDEKVEETQSARLLVRERIDIPFFRTTSRLVAAVMRRPATDLQTRLHAISLFGLVFVFQMDRTRIAANLGWEDHGAENIALLKSIVGEQTSILLRGLVPSERPPL